MTTRRASMSEKLETPKFLILFWGLGLSHSMLRNMNMDLHLITENHNDDNDDASSSSGTDEDETDPSSLFDNETSPEKVAERQKRRKAFIEQEEKHVRNVRRALALAILICAVVVSTSVYVLARKSEYHSFMHEVCCRNNLSSA